MEVQEQEIIVTRAQWCPEAEKALMGAARGWIRFYRAEVERGISILWRVTGAADVWLVTRQEDDIREIVIVAGAGRNCRVVIRHVRQVAKAAGFSTRMHIVREGLRRIAEGEGFKLDEMVMRAD